MKRFIWLFCLSLFILTSCTTTLVEAETEADKALSTAVAKQIIVQTCYHYSGEKAHNTFTKELVKSVLPAMKEESFFKGLSNKEVIDKMTSYLINEIFVSDKVKQEVCEKIYYGHKMAYSKQVYLIVLIKELE